MYDIIIIGAGPAGLTAAIYARRAEKKVLVLEAMAYGGQIINTPDIENFPTIGHISGYDFATKLYHQAKNLGAEFIFEKVTAIQSENGLQIVSTVENQYRAKAVIIATGTKNRPLGLSNESALIGKGISYCATCDGQLYKGKVVAVQGGGNTAVEEALYLADIAKTVYLIHRRNEFRADEAALNQLKAKTNVQLLVNSNVTKLNADDKLTSIEVTDNDGKVSTLEVAALFVAVGRVPAAENFNAVINLDEFGYIISGEDCHTNIDGIFVAGDSRTKALHQIVTATADGAIAATEAVKYINGI